MSVKRKKAKGDGKKDGVAVLLEHMREKLGQEQFDAIAQEVLNPKVPTEQELRDEAMLSFSNSISELPKSLEPPPDFILKWEILLDWHEQKEREWLSIHTGNPSPSLTVRD